MNNRKNKIACLFFVFLLFTPLGNITYAVNAEKPPRDRLIERLLSTEHVTGEIIIKMKRDSFTGRLKGIMPSEVDALIPGALVKKTFRRLKGLGLVKLPSHISMTDALRTFMKSPLVEYAEPNYIVHEAVSPDDPYFSSLWGLHNTGQTGGTADADIDAPEAWDFTTGSANVIIAIVDSGVAYNHPDISTNLWTNPGEQDCSNGIDDDNNGYTDDCIGWDFVGNDNDPTDFNGHGTHVAGTIAALGNNSTGITGIMWRAQIMPLRFIGVSGSGDTASAVSAILYADEKGADVINNSWGSYSYSQALKDAIDASNAVVVCAAGNYGMDNDQTPHYPSSYSSPNIISVAASSHNDDLIYFSNFGETSVDLAAPGVNIRSTVPELSYDTPVTLYSEDFDGGSGKLPLLGWDRGGSNSTWAVTENTGTGGGNSLEDSPRRDYRNYTTSWAGYMTQFPSVSDNVYTLYFTWKGFIETNYDYLDIIISADGATWSWVDYRTGSTNGSFIEDSSDGITIAADLYDSFYFGFGIESDFSVTEDGVYIDDVVLTREPVLLDGYGYEYYSGTSMATPHVSGVAGLIKSFNPFLTNLEIIDVILDTVDSKSDLTGKVAAGGRLNAFNALSSLECPYLPVRNADSGTEYSSLQSAYIAAVDGDVIQSHADIFTESPAFDLNKTVIFEGGYDCTYSSVAGVTTLSGSMTAENGTVTIGNFVIE